MNKQTASNKSRLIWLGGFLSGILCFGLQMGCQHQTTAARSKRFKQFPRISSKVAGSMMRDQLSKLDTTLRSTSQPKKKVRAWKDMLDGMRPLVQSLRSYQLQKYLTVTAQLKRSHFSHYRNLPSTLHMEQKAIEETAKSYITTIKMAMRSSQKRAERAISEAKLEDHSGVSKKALRSPRRPKKRVKRAARSRFPSLGLFFPLPHHQVGSKYGWRRGPISKRWGFHTGIDIGARRGLPILSAAGGVVIRARYMGSCGYGVIIKHKQTRYRRVTTTYCHMSRILVRRKQRIKRGQRIGKIGTTGNSTGPHLHFAVHINGRHVNPMHHFRSRD